MKPWMRKNCLLLMKSQTSPPRKRKSLSTKMKSSSKKRMKTRTTSGACAVVRNPSPDDSRSHPSPRKNRSAADVSSTSKAHQNKRGIAGSNPPFVLMCSRLWVNAPYLRCFRDTRNGKHISGQPQIAGELIGLLCNRREGPIHNDLQLLGDLFHAPEEALQVLYPFKVADGNATGIGQDVRNNHDALLKENPVRFWRGWPIRRLRDNARLHSISVGCGEDTLGSSRNQNIAGNLKHLLHANGLRAREANYAAALLLK